MDKAHSYYNENDPKAAAWLRELIKQGHIADGVVDERSIEDVRPDELTGYTQCHFFAGIGGWSYALRLAGWPDDRPVWTGSCPCQPFSAAGKQGGTGDKRHLWPEFFRLIAERKPPVIFGEQVASKPGLAWLDIVQADLEGAGYAVGAADLCAAGVGAPHIRQRLYFVADSAGEGLLPSAFPGVHSREESAGARYGEPERHGAVSLMADAKHDGHYRQAERAAPKSYHNEPDERIPDRDSAAGLVADSLPARRPEGRTRSGNGSPAGRGVASESGNVEHPIGSGLEGHAGDGDDGDEPGRHGEDQAGSVAETGWSRCDWLPCRDGKARPVEPGTFPLAHGIPARVGRLRGYGNAIVPQVAAAFIEATELCHT